MKTHENFVHQPLFSPVLPDYDLREITAHELSDAIAEFFNQKFKGLIGVTVNVERIELIKAAPECLAYFLKTLLKFIDASCFIYLTCFLTDNSFVMELKPSRQLCLSVAECSVLCRFARSAGFDINIEKSEIRLTAKLFTPHKIMKIYEKPSLNILHIFNEIFDE